MQFEEAIAGHGLKRTAGGEGEVEWGRRWWGHKGTGQIGWESTMHHQKEKSCFFKIQNSSGGIRNRDGSSSRQRQ